MICGNCNKGINSGVKYRKKVLCIDCVDTVKLSNKPTNNKFIEFYICHAHKTSTYVTEQFIIHKQIKNGTCEVEVIKALNKKSFPDYGYENTSIPNGEFLQKQKEEKRIKKEGLEKQKRMEKQTYIKNRELEKQKTKIIREQWSREFPVTSNYLSSKKGRVIIH